MADKERPAKRNKTEERSEQGGIATCIREKLMAQVAQHNWSWQQEAGLGSNHEEYLHPDIRAESEVYTSEMQQMPTVIEPTGSLLITLMIDENRVTHSFLRDNICPMKLKVGTGSLSLGHIIPPNSIVHGFIFLHKETEELQLSMFDISCLKMEMLNTQRKRDRNRFLRTMFTKAWRYLQVQATNALLAFLQHQDTQLREIGLHLEKLCKETSYHHELLADIAWCRAADMGTVSMKQWESIPEIRHVRYPGQISENIHWQPMMTAAEAMQIEPHKYEEAGAPTFHAPLLLPEVDERDLCRRLA